MLRGQIPDDVEDTITLFRPLRQDDPNFAVGAFVDEWLNEGSEIGSYHPTINMYKIEVQAICKSMDPQKGILIHSLMARNIRRLLAGSDDLRTTWGQNVDAVDVGFERFMKATVMQQKYLSNEVGGVFFYMSVTPVIVETEYVNG